MAAVLALILYRLTGWALTPLLLVVSALHPRLRVRWAERWSWRLPAVEPGAVVIHGASVGEGRAAQALAIALREHRPRRVLLRCAFTDTGLETARDHDVLAALPFDVPWVVRRWLDRLRPRALVLVESELWPVLLSACAARGIPVAVVGARVGRGTERLRRLSPRLWRRLDAAIGLWVAADEAGAAALRTRVSGRVEVGGELKADAPPPAAALRFERPWIVAGSTRPGDEAAVLDALAGMEEPPVVVLAPRHRERFEEVAAWLEGRGVAWARRSALGDGRVPAGLDVVLLDTVGELAGLYPGAAAAFVGGTFDPAIGGHSPAEASRAGVPAVRGPHAGANAAAWAAAREGAGELVAPSPAALGAALEQALAAAPGTAGGAAAERRPSRRVAELLRPLLDAPVPPEVPYRPLLWPLAAGWVALARLRVALIRPVRVGVPVISVGNLASGGTGKTPVVDLIAAALAARGRRPAVLCRGYGRDPDGPALRLSGRPGDSPPDGRWLGDEAAQHAARGWLVVSCPDRVAGAAAAIEAGADVLVLDDGFQHVRLVRDLDIVVVDAARPLAGGPIPVGERREGLAALRRADLLWVNHGAVPASLSGRLARPERVVTAALVPRCWLISGREEPLDALSGEVDAAAAIARPGRFLQALLELGLVVRRWRTYADHARFPAAAGPRPLVVTEKDLARLPPGAPAVALRVDCRVTSGQDVLDAALDEVLA